MNSDSRAFLLKIISGLEPVASTSEPCATGVSTMATSAHPGSSAAISRVNMFLEGKAE